MLWCSAKLKFRCGGDEGGELTEAIGESRNARRLLSLPELHDDVGFCLRWDAFDLIVDAPAVSNYAEAARHLRPKGMYVSTNPIGDVGGLLRAAFSSRRAGYLMMLTTTPSKLDRLAALWAEGALRPVVDSVYPMADAQSAFDRFATRGKQGRVLLRIAGQS